MERKEVEQGGKEGWRMVRWEEQSGKEKKRRLVRSRKQGGKGGMEEGGNKRGVGWKGGESRVDKKDEEEQFEREKQGGKEGWRRLVRREKQV